MKLGVSLGALNPGFWVDATVEADRLGYDSVWMPEHLIFTRQMSRSPHPGEEHPPVPPDTPIFDAFVYLAFLAGKTTGIRFGTYVYNIGLRHPFTTARTVQTLDLVSGGRVEFGIGASWLEEEWVAAELDFRSRGRRVDECIEVCKLLWTTDGDVSYHGEFFHFDDVVFLPKCVQQPHPPILVGGASNAAYRRAAKYCDGWVGMRHTLDTVRGEIETIRALLEEERRDPDAFEYCFGGQIESLDDLRRWEDAGVTAMPVAPWRRSREAIDGLRRLADIAGLEARL